MPRKLIQLSLLDLCPENQSLDCTQLPSLTVTKLSSLNSELAKTAVNAPSEYLDSMPIYVEPAADGSLLVNDLPNESPILSTDWVADASRGQKQADYYHVGDRVKVLNHQFMQGAIGTIIKIEVFSEAQILLTLDFGTDQNLWAISPQNLEVVYETT